MKRGTLHRRAVVTGSLAAILSAVVWRTAGGYAQSGPPAAASIPGLPAPWSAAAPLGPGDPPLPTDPPYIEGHLLVRYQPRATAAQKKDLNEQYGGQVIDEIPQLGIQVLQFAEADALVMVSAYQENDVVMYAEPDYIARVPERETYAAPGPRALGWLAPGWLDAAPSEASASTVEADPLGLGRLLVRPNDPQFASQWHHGKIESEGAWELGRAENVVIAVNDTGVYCDHPDLKGKCVPGYDFVNRDDRPNDDYGHGTHVAGIAAAMTNNGVGVAGIGWEAKILPVKVLGSSGSGGYSTITQGVTWAADHGADIINMSLGGPYSSKAMADAIKYAHDKGVTVICAAGNDNTSNPSYPAAYPYAIGVASTTQTDTKSSFSNFGNYIDIAAPGSAILSTLMNGSYGSMSGTSMASPAAAGVASLVKGQNRNRTPDQIEQILEQSADDLGEPGPDKYFGAGRVNARKALALDPNGGGPPPPPPTGQPGGPTSPPPTPRPATATPAIGQFVQQVEDLINQERAGVGLRPLMTNQSLRDAAGGFTDDLGRSSSSCRDHSGSDGSTPYDRMRRASYPNPYGEVMACGQVSPAAVVAAWMGSPAHRAILLCTSCTEFGAGFTQATGGFRTYWAVDFGSRRITGGATPTLVRPTAPRPTPTDIPPPTLAPATPTATSLPGTNDIVLEPEDGNAGWVVSSQPNLNHFDDVDMFTGTWNGLLYHGAVRFSLASIPEGMYINYARLELTGRSSENLSKNGTWSVRVMNTDIDAKFESAGYIDIHGTLVDSTLLPLLGIPDLGAGRTNVFSFTPSQLNLLQNRIRASKHISFRIDGPTSASFANLFTWDTGQGPESIYPGPRLIINWSRVPPPTVPTPTVTDTPLPTSTPLPPTAGPSPTPTITPLPPTPTYTAPPPVGPGPSLPTLPPPVATPGQGDASLELVPQGPQYVGWAKAGENRNHFGDANIFAGYYQGRVYLGAAQFDLSAVPPGSKLRAARLVLTGLTRRWLSPDGNGFWNARILGPQGDDKFPQHTFLTLSAAPIVSTLDPDLRQRDLDVGTRNVFAFRDFELQLVEQRLATTGKLSFVFDGPYGGLSNLATWDSGFGPGSREGPVLQLVFGPPRDGEKPPATPGPAPTSTPISAPPGNTWSQCQANMIAAINRTRDQFGVPIPLAQNDRLTRAAEIQNQDMVTHNFFSHTGSDGSTPEQRVARVAYAAETVGEVLAANTSDIEVIVSAWLRQGQKDELLNPRYTQVGVSCLFRPNTDYFFYWTVVFAKPRQ